MDERIYSTLVVYAVYVSVSILDNIYAPCLNDIVDQLSSSLENVSIGLSMAVVGYCIGTLSFGHLMTRTDVRNILIACLAVGFLTTLATPHLRDVPLFILCQSLTGFVLGGLDVGSNSWMLRMWGSDSNPAFYGMHLCYMFTGAALPMAVAPFLSTHGDDDSVNNDAVISEMVNITASRLDKTSQESRIVTPFTAAATVIASATIMLVAHVVKVSSIERNHLNLEDGDKEGDEQAENHVKFDWRIIAACSLICSLYTVQASVFTFITQFALHSSFPVSRSTASNMLSLLVFFAMIFRLISVPLSMILKSSTVLIINLTYLGSGLMMHAAFAKDSEILSCISRAMIGAGIGSSLPSVIALASQEINAGSKTITYIIFAARLATAPAHLFLGSVMETNPIVFSYFTLIGFTIICLSLTLLMILRK